jgi:hypothetical protein
MVTLGVDPTPWEILGIPADSTPGIVRTAWRRGVREFHPDASGGGNIDRFHEINRAYETISARFVPVRGADPVVFREADPDLDLDEPDAPTVAEQILGADDGWTPSRPPAAAAPAPPAPQPAAPAAEPVHDLDDFEFDHEVIDPSTFVRSRRHGFRNGTSRRGSTSPRKTVPTPAAAPAGAPVQAPLSPPAAPAASDRRAGSVSSAREAAFVAAAGLQGRAPAQMIGSAAVLGAAATALRAGVQTLPGPAVSLPMSTVAAIAFAVAAGGIAFCWRKFPDLTSPARVCAVPLLVLTLAEWLAVGAVPLAILGAVALAARRSVTDREDSSV